jgi:hypothetical protein
LPQRRRKVAKRKTGTTYAAVEKMLLGWPGVELSTSYGRPSLKIKGKFYTWVKEDGDSIVIGGIGFDERDVLMETQGDVFYITDHYRNSRYVLMRLSKADPAIVAAYLRRRWFEIAPKKLHAAFEDAQMPPERRRKVKPAARTNLSKPRRQVRQPRR